MNWPITRLRYVADLNPAVRDDLKDRPDAEVSFLPMEAIGEDGSINLERQRPVFEVCNGYTYFEDGDVAFAKVTPCFENGKGALMHGLELGAGFGTSELTVLRPKAATDARFLDYVIRSQPFRQHGAGAMTGAGGLKRVPDEFTRDFKTPWPGMSEQQRIANFLDEKTARIDALIAEKERLVSSLSNLRKSVIHAIITGTYSESGVKTGNRHFPVMARGWAFTRVKYIATSLDGKRIPLNSEERAVRQGEFPYYGASGPIDCIDAYIFDEPLVLVGEDGANLLNRATPLAFVAEGKYWVNNHAHILRPHDGRVRLWARAIDSLDITDWVSGSAQPKLTIDALMSLPVPEIPENIRDELDAALAREESRIDALVTHTVEHISLLHEYRSSLISAAVTGQLNIDDFKARQLEAA